MNNEVPENEGDVSPDESEDDNVISRAVPVPTKTPLFQALHAERYQRQAIITKIQERTGRWLICYVSGPDCAIDRDDTVPFVDLLHNVPPSQDLDLLLHTGGGDIDAAEKLISMVRNKVGAATLRVIVPDFAKSAGTLMVLGADSVVMSDTSELGPIDPQIILADGNGNRIRHSVQSYLDAYDEHTATLKSEPNNMAAQIMLNKLDPATVKLFQAVKDRARKFAEDQLKRGMFRNGGNWSLAAGELLDTKRWQSHAQMISYEDARDPKIGLNVEYLDPKSDEWQEYWQLYCLQRLAVRDRQKLFESDYASLLIEAPSVSGA
jgi:ATP-dependent protease ClpP protease subunit